MVSLDQVQPALTHAFGRLLRHVQAPGAEEAADLDAGLLAWGRAKAAQGRASLAARLGLQEAELHALDAAARDVERTRTRAGEEGAQAARNALLAQVRLLSWLETVGLRTPTLALEADVATLVSEDLGRKQVRALELLLRSLITESHGDQERLIARLRSALGDAVVRKWQATGDAGDILSGCTFSELASLFVDREEFARYEPLYDDTPFLTLLKQRRRTVQAFLDDVRRIRNVLAHNKRITPLQLTLLDLYYEEIVTPVQHAFDQGETRVDPQTYLEVSKEELDGYVAGLHQDLRSVKEDLGELREELKASLGALQEDARDIQATTRRSHRRLAWIGAGVGLAVVASVLLLVLGSHTRETASRAREAAERTQEHAAETTREVAALREQAAAQSEATQEVARRVDEATESLEDATSEAAAAARDTQAAAEAAARQTERVVQTLEEMREGFASLLGQGGIIADPKRPQEHYHNARLYEQRGDALKALQSYRGYFASTDVDAVDPYLRFQALLRAQEGAAGAREELHALTRTSPSLSARLAWLLLLDGEARTQGLEALVAEHPEFAPGVYALGREFSVARLGSQSLEDKRREKESLERFLALEAEGRLLPHFLDRSLAAEQAEDARERLAALATLPDEVLANPVKLTAHRSGAGWMAVLSIPDTTKEIFVRVGEEGEYRSTGFVPGVTSHAGLPLAQPQIVLGEIGPTTLYVKYTDPRDREHGPYAVAFDPEAALFASLRRMVELTERSWLSFRDWDGKLLLYFTTLLANRAALQEIRYGLDVEEPDRTFPLGTYDPKNPHAIGNDDTVYLEVPPETRYVVVQVRYRDGTQSEIVRFER